MGASISVAGRREGKRGWPEWHVCPSCQRLYRTPLMQGVTRLMNTKSDTIMVAAAVCLLLMAAETEGSVQGNPEIEHVVRSPAATLLEVEHGSSNQAVAAKQLQAQIVHAEE